ncbi:MAG: HAMP domain-containing protein, partial [Planctomycetota bacterium]|nr:HAMP domain-containing protein [Planctomycetota bacterium]
MSLRLRLLAIFGGLLLLMMASEWWLVRSLTQQYEKRTGQVAFHVGESLLSAFGDIDVSTSPNSTIQRVSLGAAPTSKDFIFERDVHPPHRAVFSTRHKFTEIKNNATLKGPRLVLAFRSGKKTKDPSKATKAVRALKRRRIVRLKQPFFPTVEEEIEVLVGPKDAAKTRELEAQVLKELVVKQKALKDKQLALPAKNERVKARLFLLNDQEEEFRFSPPVTDDKHWNSSELPPSVWFSAPSERPAGGTIVDLKSGDPHKNAYFSGNNLFIPIPQEGLKEAQQAFLRQWLYGSAFILLIGLLAVAWIAHHVSKPLQELADAAKELGDGKLGTQVVAKGDREVLSTVAAFNKMSYDLERLTKETRLLRDREHLTEIGEMSRGLAHSLRNPLNILGLCLEELGELAGDEGEDLARSSRDQIERMDRSLRSLLALSTSRSVQELSIDDVARDVALEITQGQLGTVSLDIQGTEPPP